MSVVIPSLRAAIAVPPWVKNELWRKARAMPSLDLRFADNKSLVDAVTGASLITFTRASNGTFVDSAGVLQTAATDVPRFDHDPVTGESLGLLGEEQRTNLLLRSEEFGTTWSPSNISITSDAAIAPNGNLTADKAIATSTNATHQLYQVTSGTSGVTYTFSFYVKAGEFNRFSFGPGNAAVGGGDKTAVINLGLSNPVVSQDAFLNNSTFVTLVGNGWFRVGCTFTATATGTMTVATLQTLINNSGDSSYAGDGTSGLFLWGAQLEAGAFPTSYIPTITAAVTRSADVASIGSSAFTSFYNQSEGVMFASGDFVNAGAVNFPRTVSLAGANAGIDEISFYTRISVGEGDGSIFGAVTVNSSPEGDLGGPTVSPNLSGGYRSAIAYKADDFGLSSNGLTPTTDTSGTLPTITQLIIMGHVRFQNRLSGHVRRITYWPQRLANSTLQTLTQ